MTPKNFAVKAKKSLEVVARKLGAERVDLNDQVAKVSAVGTGFRHSPKIAATMFSALADQKINIHMISASDLRVSCIVDLAHGESALRTLHKAFGLARGKK
jgi:aspartate kinase